MKILITQYIPTEGLRDLLENHEVIMPETGGFTFEEQKEHIKDTDILLSLFNSPVPKELMEVAPNLKMISNFGVGYNNIDLNYAKERGVIVSNTPDPVTLPTAEHSMGLILAVMRRISEMDRKLREGKVADWKVMSNLGNTLNEKTLGIIGLGKIGQATAKLAQAFGMNVLYYSRNQKSETEEQELNTVWVALDDLLRSSDVVSLHVPLTAETKHMICTKEFQLMKNSAYIINTARGPVIDEKALANALENREIAGAGIDVFEEEPKIHEKLFGFDNVVLTPHIATGTIETRIETAKCAADNIMAFIAGEEVPNRVL
ncbi:MAG: hydroxyacid dehydrogenase [Salinivirgaceae bacterium]|nr:hydroxyacid dehydrogenase [Salinivirgaceae bacterium]